MGLERYGLGRMGAVHCGSRGPMCHRVNAPSYRTAHPLSSPPLLSTPAPPPRAPPPPPTHPATPLPVLKDLQRSLDELALGATPDQVGVRKHEEWETQKVHMRCVCVCVGGRGAGSSVQNPKQANRVN